jgi:nicotinate-nucleotide--dimethylbenzimidazole phosphoribosyltransferase
MIGFDSKHVQERALTFQIEPRPLDDIRDLISGIPGCDQVSADAASARQAQIAVPSGELGFLGDLAIWLASWQGQNPPRVHKPQVVVFASSHGVAAKGVSAYGAEETAAKIRNLTTGKGGVNQIAGSVGCGLKIVELAPELPTPDITKSAALSEKDCAATIAFGMEAVSEKPDLMAVGVVGAGATTAAGAVSLALFGGTASFWSQSGSAGKKPDILVAKSKAIDDAITFHRGELDDPLEVLRRLGGRDMAAVIGAILAARYQNIPVVIDGFVATASAALLHALNPKSIEHCIIGSVTSRDSHRALLDRVGKKPVLDLGLGLGDGSGGALAISVVKAAAACHAGIGIGGA